MNWDDVRIFLAVARHGQILGAARHLRLNHATVARRLNALEAAVETRLIARKTYGCEVTETGRQFLRHAERMEAELLAAYGGAHPDDGAVSGVIRVGAPDGFGATILAPHLGELSRRHPGLTIELAPAPRSFSLSQREADIAVTVGRPEKGRLLVRKLTDYTLGLYASQRYIQECGAPASLHDLREHRLVGYVEDLLYSSDLDYTGEFLKDWRSHVAVSTIAGQIEVIRSGAGVGILPAFMAREFPELVALLPSHVATRAFWILTHEDSRPSRQVANTIDFIVEITARHRAIFT
jgi:DNA-binding transcriptional LysR family regulator